ncbi:arginine-ornithine antiporter [Dyella sp. C9]|uniref:arginine-ornithine antiporter n=1 Tax=Dyella sp. C9 TaxID=2202154 RepID=UPI000DEF6BC7|nr:arginine-ornithine antiporter [Dyella sp. C9]
MEAKNTGLGLAPLIALVIGSMVGAGIFSLPQNIAQSSGAGAAIIGWLISGTGMLMLAFVFQTLAIRKPHLDTGVYAYARAGFGPYMGFSSAWGYWVSSLLGNVSYLVLIFSGLGHFLPMFGEGNTVAALIGSSVLLWAMHAMILRGVRQAAVVNTIVTVAKLVPIIVFLIIAAIAFRLDIFRGDLWGTVELGSLMHQLRGMMLITVWVFIGIEGASIYSRRAAKRSDVGKATVIGFLSVLCLLVLVNLLSMGVMQQPELAGLRNPSMAYVLQSLVGPWGATLIIVGMIVSVLGALLAWVLFCAEVLFAAGGDGTMPSFLARENTRKAPAAALWMTNGVIQLFLVWTFFNASTYTSLVMLAASMSLIPYLFSAGYGLLLAVRGETYQGEPRARRRDTLVSGVAVLYSLWLVYAGGLEHLLLSLLLYAPGVVLFAIARRERREPIFVGVESLIFALIAAAALFALWGLHTGLLAL